MRRLGLSFRDVDWRDWDRLLRRVHAPAKQVTVALVGKYVDLPDAYLSVSEALRAGGFANDAKVEIRWVASRHLRHPRGRRARPRGRRRRARPGRLRRARHRGQARCDPARPRDAARRCSGCAWAAVHGHRGRPRPGRHREGRLDRVRPGLPRPGHRHDGRPARRRRRRARHGRHHAPRPVADRAAEGLAGGGRLRRRAGDRAAPAPLRGQQRLPPAARGGRAGLLRHVPGRHARRDRRAAARGPPVLRRHAGAPRVPLAADPGAPAVPRLRRRRRSPTPRSGCSRSRPDLPVRAAPDGARGRVPERVGA